jgi:hypothetical protein
VPTFCRHNRFIERCPICRKELDPPATAGAASRPRRASSRDRRATGAGSGRARGQVRVRRAPRAEADGYSCSLIPGIHASADAARLADELAFAGGRLTALATAPVGPYAEAGSDPDRERGTALAFLISYLSPLEDGDPFAAIRAARPDWEAGGVPALDGIQLGPRSSHDPARGSRTLEAYRAWVDRAGTQSAAFTGEPGWTPQRRFERIFERLALPGLTRTVRYDLLVTLGRLGLYELEASSLALLEGDPTTLAAKRVFGIGDRLLLERRAAELASACQVPVAALDLALAGWERGERIRAGFEDGVADAGGHTRILAALGLTERPTL